MSSIFSLYSYSTYDISLLSLSSSDYISTFLEWTLSNSYCNSLIFFSYSCFLSSNSIFFLYISACFFSMVFFYSSIFYFKSALFPASALLNKSSSYCSFYFFSSNLFISLSYWSNFFFAALIFFCSYLSLYISVLILFGSLSSYSLLFLCKIFLTLFKQHSESLFPWTENSTNVLFFSRISSKIFSIFSEIKLSAAFKLLKFSKQSSLSKKCRIPVSLTLLEETSNFCKTITLSAFVALSAIIYKLSSPSRFLEILRYLILVLGRTSAR